jgi:hypothetical protein
LTRDISQNQGMPSPKFLVPVGSLLLVLAAYYFYRWAGVAVAVSALVMWLLLHFSRMLQVLRRTTNRPIGYVDSAVMLNAKLQPGMTLLHVVAMTQSLGERICPKDTQPERYCWTDGTQSHVTCEFHGGKLKKWALIRPLPAGEALNTGIGEC